VGRLASEGADNEGEKRDGGGGVMMLCYGLLIRASSSDCSPFRLLNLHV
jgi:hypothetical protein